MLGNLFVSWWFIWYLGRRHAFSLGTIVILLGVALQAGGRVFSMVVVGRIIAGIGTAMYVPLHHFAYLLSVLTWQQRRDQSCSIPG